MFIKFKQFMQSISSFDRKESINIIIRPKISKKPDEKETLDLVEKIYPKT